MFEINNPLVLLPIRAAKKIGNLNSCEERYEGINRMGRKTYKYVARKSLPPRQIRG